MRLLEQRRWEGYRWNSMQLVSHLVDSYKANVKSENRLLDGLS